MSRHQLTATIAAILCLGCVTRVTLSADAVDVKSLAATLQAVGPKGEGHQAAAQAWRELAQADVQQLPEVLAGMKGAGQLSENWFRAVVETIAQRHVQQGGTLPVASLEEFLADTDQSPRARRLAYELIAKVDDTAEQRLIPELLDDPSVELRRDAVTLAMTQAEKLQGEGLREQAAQAYWRIFAAARSLDQIKAATAKLRELDQPVSVPLHMGFVMDWRLVGPFDNTGNIGFDTAYPPEQGVDLKAKYQGKVGEVAWVSHTTADEYGMVDLNVIFQRPKEGDAYQLTEEHKGTVAYAYSEFFSDSERDVELRLGCINANKVWLNGELLTANQVYHANTEIDQYLARGRLKAGRNTILVKICQNEQTESWAQLWQFQLRVCDQIGTAVLSADRVANQTTASGAR